MDGAICVLEGEVVSGKRLGRTIGFPTANMAVERATPTRAGVYYGRCELDGRAYRVILNIGVHPTVPEGPPTVEAHLIDYEGDLYGRRISVALKKFLRGERKFESLEALREQLARDQAAARALPL